MCKISVGGEEMTSNLHNWTGEFVAEKVFYFLLASNKDIGDVLIHNIECMII